ncbi:MAG: nucleoside diphosphate kinase regulator [Elusimicrobia bacterium]|nr:nucleoside diphosphate kinase regulator [Elusimicrobiota bacterium]
MNAVERKIYITRLDFDRLSRLVMVASEYTYKAPEYIKALKKELDRASIMEAESIPKNVVTMNSKLRLRDIDNDEEMIYTLVFPEDASAEDGMISIISPVGTAILGYSEGDIVEWPIPTGVCHIKIEEILFQPETSGNYNI